MKASELMIGDLVAQKHGGLLLKVSEVRPPYIIADGEDGQFHDGTLEPIPLTVEILEHNGFEKKGHRYGIYDDYFDLNMYEYNDGTWLVLYHCCGMSLPDEQLLICYVHQLQHFMRHCGIDKKIVIKK